MFPSHLYIDGIPYSSGQFAELIVYIIPLEEICIVTRSYSILMKFDTFYLKKLKKKHI